MDGKTNKVINEHISLVKYKSFLQVFTYELLRQLKMEPWKGLKTSFTLLFINFSCSYGVFTKNTLGSLLKIT